MLLESRGALRYECMFLEKSVLLSSSSYVVVHAVTFGRQSEEERACRCLMCG